VEVIVIFLVIGFIAGALGMFVGLLLMQRYKIWRVSQLNAGTKNYQVALYGIENELQALVDTDDAKEAKRAWEQGKLLVPNGSRMEFVSYGVTTNVQVGELE